MSEKVSRDLINDLEKVLDKSEGTDSFWMPLHIFKLKMGVGSRVNEIIETALNGKSSKNLEISLHKDSFEDAQRELYYLRIGQDGMVDQNIELEVQE